MIVSASSIARAALMLAALGAAAPAVADSCAADDVLYMALEPMQELLGVRGETRAQFLDRNHPGWQEGAAELVSVVAAPVDQALRFWLTAPSGLTIERVDLVVESQLDFVDRDNRRTQRFGHREIARYVLDADATSEIAVPREAFREPGALLVIARVRRTDVAGAQGVLLRALPVPLASCPRRIYTHDRFSAIRLNRGGKK